MGGEERGNEEKKDTEGKRERERQTESKCVCVCVTEREREREGKRERDHITYTKNTVTGSQSLLTFPIANSPLSKIKMTPSVRKQSPNTTRPKPISEIT